MPLPARVLSPLAQLQLLLTRPLSLSLSLSPLLLSLSLRSPRLCSAVAMASVFPAHNGIQNGPANGYVNMSTSANANVNANGAGTESSSPRTLTALGRWSILSKQLPPVHTINTVHVYDFDNTCMSLLVAMPTGLSLLVLDLLTSVYVLTYPRSIPDSASEPQIMEHPHPGQTREPRHLRQRRLVA